MPRTSGLFRVIPASPDYLLRYPDSREASFSDVLRNYNGYEPRGGWMDLRANMKLRIENAYYRPGSSRRGLEGFLGTEVAEYQVRRNGELQLASIQSMKDRPSDELPVQQLIGTPQTHYRYHRFYYEVFFKRAGEARGSVLLSSNAVDDLDRMAAQLRSDPDSVCKDRSKSCTVFPEACSVSVEMEIVVNGKARTVLWGNVLSDIADKPRNLELLRISNRRLLPVELDASDENALELPLLPGDHVSWR